MGRIADGFKVEWRCTRNSSGIKELRGRQGHYIMARNQDEALSRMRVKFPQDWEGFTANSRDEWLTDLA